MLLRLKSAVPQSRKFRDSTARVSRCGSRAACSVLAAPGLLRRHSALRFRSGRSELEKVRRTFSFACANRFLTLAMTEKKGVDAPPQE